MSRQLWFFMDLDEYHRLPSEDQSLMEVTLTQIGTWTVMPQVNAIEVFVEYGDWLMWALKNPDWAVLWRIGE